MRRTKRVNRKSLRKNRKNKNIFVKFKEKYFKYDFSKYQINRLLMFLSILIGIIGIFSVLSASSYLTIKNDLNKYYYVIRQAIYFAVGITAMFIISKINYNFYKEHAYKIYVFTIILLILCYVPGFSVRTNGSRRSIRLLITFMPADFAKPAAIFALVAFLISKNHNRDEFFKSVVPVGGIILIPFLLILFQTDLSTSLVLLVTLSLVYIVGGFRTKFLPIVLIMVLGMGYFLYENLRGYQLDRLTAFLNPEKHYEDLSWQVLNGLFAVSRGGIDGAGFGQSIYKQGYLATEVNNDMIFAVFAEEMGFIGSVIFLLLVFLITYIIIKEGLKSRDRFAKITCFGIAVLYFTQSLLNIGVALSVVPNTGITLPFISNGGTSLVAFYAMFGIVLNISRKNKYEQKLEKERFKEINE